MAPLSTNAGAKIVPPLKRMVPPVPIITGLLTVRTPPGSICRVLPAVVSPIKSVFANAWIPSGPSPICTVVPLSRMAVSALVGGIPKLQLELVNQSPDGPCQESWPYKVDAPSKSRLSPNSQRLDKRKLAKARSENCTNTSNTKQHVF